MAHITHNSPAQRSRCTLKVLPFVRIVNLAARQRQPAKPGALRGCRNGLGHACPRACREAILAFRDKMLAAYAAAAQSAGAATLTPARSLRTCSPASVRDESCSSATPSSVCEVGGSVMSVKASDVCLCPPLTHSLAR